MFPNPSSSPLYPVPKSHLVQRPPACLPRLHSGGPVDSGWGWSQLTLSGRAWALGGHLHVWAMYVVTLWPEPGRIKDIKHVISGILPLWGRGKCFFAVYLSQPTQLRFSWAAHCRITFERKESGCLQDCREEEKEKKKRKERKRGQGEGERKPWDWTKTGRESRG